MVEESKKSIDNSDIYNVEAAEILANEALVLPIAEAAPIYEKLLSTFPTAAKYWRQYVEAYKTVKNDEACKQIFSRCLLNCLEIALWRSYISFIRKANDKRGFEGLEETRKAYDFMLNYVGDDIASGPVWVEYITFLKSLPATTNHEGSQRMTSLRKVYQRAFLIPTNQVEQLWRDYENFENTVSRTLAKGLLSDYQPKYNSAKAIYKERKKFIDDIDMSLLAVPPNGSFKEQQQCMAWKKLLAFEKANPQRIDTAAANKRITFTYEQCLMYLYHYPDIWYDYATWHAKNGSMDSAIKIFQRALKALPECTMLKYAYAELEESRGAIQSSKRIYESIIADNAEPISLAHIQFIRFLRRTEGNEAARRYFLDAWKSPNCSYHVYVAYAMMVFCLDKDAKVAHSVFEAGLKRFMQEPGYILEYADFLCRLNDDRNVRALFERALSSLPLEKSTEVWNRFVQFEQTYGDLSSLLKVEQRRKEALSKVHESTYTLESSLYDVVSRYSFMDLWPCSPKHLDYLAREEWLAKNGNKADKSILQFRSTALGKDLIGHSANTKATPISKVVLPDTSRMVIYDPRQTKGPDISATAPTLGNSSIDPAGVGTTKDVEELMKVLSPSLLAFITNLPAVDGPLPDVDVVLAVLLQSPLPATQSSNAGIAAPITGPVSADVPGQSKSGLNQNGSAVHRPPRNAKRKELARQEDDESTNVPSRPLPKDVFRLRQIQRMRGASSAQAATGSVVSSGSAVSSSGASAFSEEQSGSTG